MTRSPDSRNTKVDRNIEIGIVVFEYAAETGAVPEDRSPRSRGPALLDHARVKTFKLFAVDSPFESKDLQKGRGYR